LWNSCRANQKEHLKIFWAVIHQDSLVGNRYHIINVTRNWNDINWIFAQDGSLVDMYIQDVTISDWEKLIDFLNLNYDLKYGEDDSNQIDKDYALRYLNDETGEMEFKLLRVYLYEIQVNCFFFLPDQIEFDIHPGEVTSLLHFERIEKFMTAVSIELNNQVTLTAENSPEFPLFKIDFDKGINKILTKEEAEKLSGPPKFLPMPNEEQMIKSVSEPYRATSKDENLW